MNKYIIVPDCLDLNRGDQALLWETVRVAQDAGFEGEYYVQSEPEFCQQSKANNLKSYSALLPHPSRNKRTNNIKYGHLLTIKWGLIAVLDLIKSLYLLFVARYPNLYWTLPSKTRKTIKLYREAKAMFVKGGGFLDTYGGLSAPYFVYYHLFSLYIANRLRIQIYFMPNSFGPLNGLTVKWQVNKALSKCKAVFCRESISKDYMEKYFTKIPTINTYDLGFYLQPAIDNQGYNITKRRNSVAITVRPYRFPENSNGSELYKKYLLSIREFVTYLIAKNYYPHFIQHTLAINLHEDDLTAINEIIKGLPKDKFGVFANCDYNCKQMKSVYSHFDYIIGTRFHSVIFSIASNIPAIAIAYGGNKSRGIMRDIDLEEYVIDIDKITTTDLIDSFNKLVKNKDIIKTRLLKLQEQLKHERNEIIKRIQYLI